jgi:aspartate aminotransferase
VYDGRKAPNVFAAYDEVILCTSFSKDLSIPGERIGYAAVSPRSAHVDDLVRAMAFCNRALGFVNAPALQQRVVARLGDVAVDTAVYQQKRDRLVAALRALGHRYAPPEGAFYLFLAAPGGDDIAFTRRLMVERTLVVPGVGFGTPGWVRIAYCVDDASLDRGIAAFERVAQAP